MNFNKINPTAQQYINEIKNKCERIKPLAVIRCITYNHELFIRETLDSFVKQNTKFPFVAIVHDDASNDRTTDIIKEYVQKYPDTIFPILEKDNQYSRHDGSIGSIINTACEVTNAKYIAMCEGDDYWTDTYKLQKQVDFLETNSEYGMCYTKVSRLDHRSGKIISLWGGPYGTFESLYVKNTVPTLTALIRTSVWRNYFDKIKPAEHNWLMGDYPLWLYIAAKSKIKFMDEVTGVYRVLPESASHSKSIKKIYDFRTNFYKIGEEMVSLLNYPLAQDIEEAHSREKIFNILPLAILINDEQLINNAQSFYNTHKKPIRDYLLLDWRHIIKIILKLRYLKRGFSI